MAIHSKLTLRALGLAFVLVILVLAGITPARQAYEHRQRISAEQERLETLRTQNHLLQERLARLQDPDYMEKLAREQLGLVKEGEWSYVVVPPPVATATVQAPAPVSASLGRRAWTWVTGLFD